MSDQKKKLSKVMLGMATRVTGIGYLQATWHCRIKSEPGDHGKWSTQNDLTVIVTGDGQVWFMLTDDFVRELQGANESVLKILCPHGQGVSGVLTTACRTLSVVEYARRQKDPWCEFTK